MPRNRISFFGTTGEGHNPLTPDAVSLANACDDAPRRLIRGKSIKCSPECKRGWHGRCNTSPCSCSCHKNLARATYN